MKHQVSDTVSRTKSTEFNYLAIPKNEIYSALYELQIAALKIKEIKKRLFYDIPGRPAQGVQRQGIWPVRDTVHGMLGIMDEAGELAEILREYLEDPFAYGESQLNSSVIEEIGDVLWFAECAMQGMGLDVSAAEEANSRKLEARYPEGWNTFHALNRDREKEEEALRPGPPMSEG